MQYVQREVNVSARYSKKWSVSSCDLFLGWPGGIGNGYQTLFEIKRSLSAVVQREHVSLVVFGKARWIQGKLKLNGHSLPLYSEKTSCFVFSVWQGGFQTAVQGWQVGLETVAQRYFKIDGQCQRV